MGTTKELKGRRKRRFKTGSKEPVIFYFYFLFFIFCLQEQAKAVGWFFICRLFPLI